MHRNYIALLISICALLSIVTHAKASKIQYHFQLSDEEIAWIKANPEITFTGDPNWLPYEAFQSDGTYVGIVADHLKWIEKNTGLKFIPIPVSNWTESLQIATEGKVSVISGDSADIILNKQFKPVEAYSHNPIIIIMGVHQNYVERLDEIKDKKIIIIKDYGYTSEIYKLYSDFKFVEVENIQQGLEAVSSRQYDAMMATMALATYTMAEMGTHNIKVVGKTPIDMDLTLFVSKDQPILHSIINKTLKLIPNSKSQEILQNWNKSKYIEKTDYSLVIQVAVVFLLLLLLTLFWNRKLQFEIHSRHETEQLLKKIASRVPGVVYQYELRADGSSYFPYASDAIKEIYQVSPEEAHKDAAKVSSNIHPDDFDMVFNSVMESARTLSPWQLEYRLRFDDGTIRWLYGDSVPEKTSSGSILWHGFITDITERHKADEDYKRLQREQNQSQKMDALGKLTGGIAHDFNNILGIILGNAELAKIHVKRMDTSRINIKLDTILKASERARDLVAQMMVFSRSNTEDIHPMQLTPMIKEDIKMLRSLLPSSIVIDLDYQSDLPYVMMDPIKLQQILMNLCLNAKDAMNNIGKLSIHLKSLFISNEECHSCHKILQGDFVEVSVADTGTGIEKEALKRIFEPFFTTKEVGKGTGMGLAVVNTTVTNLGGHIIVHSEAEKGSTFRLLFPVTHTSQKTVAKDQYYTSSNNGLKKETILIVDDEADLAQIVSEMLEMQGYKTVTRTNSLDALKLFTSNPDNFSLLVTDQSMPNLTGTELAKKITTIKPEFPIIIATGYSDTVDKKEAEARGFGFLTKPINANNLQNLVTEKLKIS